jgi:hypothetical protein
MSSRKLRRLVEDAVLGRLPSRKRGELVAHLRSDASLRREYDRAVEAFRVLEGAEVARWEYDLVEGWLFDEPIEVAAPSHAGWLRFVGVLVAIAAGLVLALGPLRPQPSDEALTPKDGAGDRSLLAIQALCPGRGGRALVPAAEDGCDLGNTLSFAYRVDPRATARMLTLFAVDEHGDVPYYLPTPAELDPVPVVTGTWQPLPMAVELAVNHEAGEVSLYGLLSPEAPSIADIDAVGASLAAAPPAEVGDPPWHERVRLPGPVATMCAAPGACESAELSFYIHEDGR